MCPDFILIDILRKRFRITREKLFFERLYMDHSKQLGENKVASLLFKFSLPAIVGMLVNALYNVVDRIFVGRGVGYLGIAGVTVGYPIMLIMMAFGMLIGIGATTLISIRLGQQKKDEAEAIAAHGLVLLIIISLFISVAGLIFLSPLLKIFGASPEVLPYAIEYMRIILLGTIFQAVGFGMNNVIRAEGNPKIAMVTMLIGAVLNAILCYVFIFLCKWGIKGAGWATIISQGVSALWVLNYFFGKKSLLKIKRKNLKLSSLTVWQIIAIGSAPFAMQIAASVIQAVLNKSLIVYGGDIAISGMGIVQSVALLILMPIFGLNQGSQPIIGYNYGAGSYYRVKETLKLAIYAATGVVLIGFFVTQLYPEIIVRLFNNNNKDLIVFGSRALKIFLLFLPIIGFQIVSANYFQAIGKPKHAIFLSLSRQVLILIPAILILPRFLGLDGVLIAGPFSDLASSIITGIWLWRELKLLEKKRNMQYAG
jgi:putative MATE family efflux protein